MKAWRPDMKLVKVTGWQYWICLYCHWDTFRSVHHFHVVRAINIVPRVTSIDDVLCCPHNSPGLFFMRPARQLNCGKGRSSLHFAFAYVRCMKWSRELSERPNIHAEFVMTFSVFSSQHWWIFWWTHYWLCQKSELENEGWSTEFCSQYLFMFSNVQQEVQWSHVLRILGWCNQLTTLRGCKVRDQ
jgi:hypothetical protein